MGNSALAAGATRRIIGRIATLDQHHNRRGRIRTALGEPVEGVRTPKAERGEVYWMAEGACSADVVLNILARRRQPAPPAPIPTPSALHLRLEPKADCARYEGLMEVRRGAA